MADFYLDLEKNIREMYRKAATSLPEDVLKAIKHAKENEINGNSRSLLENVLENAELAKNESRPVCQDTGTPCFYIKCSDVYSKEKIIKIIQNATSIATKEIPLRENSVYILDGKSNGNKPIIHFEENSENKNAVEIELILKGGGSENISCFYSLPNAELNAGRDLEGVKKCVLDSVFNAQGKGCPPYIIGVAIGGTIEEIMKESKKQLLRKVNDENENPLLNELEKNILKEINELGIGPLGLGGKATALSVKLNAKTRHPASYFVGITFSCWALRRQKYAYNE